MSTSTAKPNPGTVRAAQERRTSTNPDKDTPEFTETEPAPQDDAWTEPANEDDDEGDEPMIVHRYPDGSLSDAMPVAKYDRWKRQNEIV